MTYVLGKSCDLQDAKQEAIPFEDNCLYFLEMIFQTRAVYGSQDFVL